MSKRILAPIALLATFLAPLVAQAQAAAGDAAAGPHPDAGSIAVAGALAIGLAAMGGGLGQGRAVAAALEGICRNPNSADKVFVPMLLGLAFIESLVIFGLLIAFGFSGVVTG